MRPPANTSSVANVRAASVGAIAPGRWAMRKPSRSLAAAPKAATWALSAELEP